jgi:ABC-type antimicrobial peptide transport system permease subunit
LLRHALSLTAGDSAKAFNKEAVMIASPLASVLHITAGDTCTVTYTTKYDPREVTLKLAITGVFTPAAGQKNNIILINEKSFFATYYDNWPKDAHDDTGMYVPKSDAPYFAALCPEWILLDRCRTTDDVKKLNHKIASSTFKGATIDVESMYEMASDVLKLEAALNMITFAAVMILFFIILIGVINTLRMTVRERTREIGTIRAIGMQKKDVRLSFLLETFFLSLFSALAGTLLAFIVMGLLSLWTINAGDNPLSMLLVNGHLHFIPTATAVGGYILLIVAIAVFTAYFPARKAANMRASDALRHYE